MLRITTVIGARPQFIKAAVVSKALHKHAGVVECIIHTGQHYDTNMSDVFFSELDIPAPSRHLNIGSGKHGEQTSAMLRALEQCMLSERPDYVLVYGDTNSTLAGALAASKLHIPIAHVEAGLRSFNRCMPEEINRVLTDHIAHLLFVPTQTAAENLHAEGVDRFGKIVFTGDVMYDATQHFGARAEKTSTILDRLGVRGRDFVLATIHRAENTDDPRRLHGILEAINEIAREMEVILPLHPRTRATLQGNSVSVAGSVRVIEPVGYFDMLVLERNARVIATDSGGVQKEAFFAHVPCVTLRDETEWVELVEAGANWIAGSETGKILDCIERALSSSPDYAIPLYGNGDAADKVAEELVQCTK